MRIGRPQRAKLSLTATTLSGLDTRIAWLAVDWSGAAWRCSQPCGDVWQGVGKRHARRIPQRAAARASGNSAYESECRVGDRSSAGRQCPNRNFRFLPGFRSPTPLDSESFGALLVDFRDRDVFFDSVELAVISHHRQFFVDDSVTLWRDDSDGLVCGHDLSIAVHCDH